jgi:hypothetical protein
MWKNWTDKNLLILIKSFCGCFTGTESVDQWVGGSVGQFDDWQAQL